MTQCNMSQNIIYFACIFKYCYFPISIIDSDIVHLMKNINDNLFDKYNYNRLIAFIVKYHMKSI